MVGPILHGDSTKAEETGLHELKKLGVQENTLVEGDSKVMMGWAMAQSKGAWRFDNIMHEIQDLVSTMKISVSFIPRAQNDTADRVAKWVVDLDDIIVADVMSDLLSWGSVPCGFPILLHFISLSFLL